MDWETFYKGLSSQDSCPLSCREGNQASPLTVGLEEESLGSLQGQDGLEKQKVCKIAWGGVGRTTYKAV